MTTKVDETSDDQHSQPPHPSTSTGKVGIAVTVLILSSLGALADTAQVIDLFSHSWVIIVLVLGICAGLAGAFLLERHWRKPLGGLALVAVALLMVGSVAVATAVVYAAQPVDAAVGFTDKRGTSPSTSSAAASTPQVPSQQAPKPLEIASPKTSTIVQWKDVVTATGTSVGPNQHVVLLLTPLPGTSVWPSPCKYEAADKRVTCHVQFGDEKLSRGSSFEVWTVIVNEKDYGVLSDYHGRGKWFDPQKPPVSVLAESERIRVKRES